MTGHMEVNVKENKLASVGFDGDGAGEDEYVTASGARELLGCSKVVLARLLKEGTLPHKTDALDQRIKWVKRSDLAALKKDSVAASAQDGAGNAKRRGRARVSRKDSQ